MTQVSKKNTSKKTRCRRNELHELLSEKTKEETKEGKQIVLIQVINVNAKSSLFLKFVHLHLF